MAANTRLQFIDFSKHDLVSSALVDEQRALQHLRQGQWAEAEAIYRSLVASGSTSPSVFTNLAAICGMQGRDQELIGLLKASLQCNPDQPEACNNLGIALQRQGDLGAAIFCFRRAIELAPDNSVCHYNLGKALQQQGELAAAIDCYRQAIQLRPHSPDAHCNLGLVLLELADPLEALACCREAIALQPSHADGHTCLAIVLLLMGEYEHGWSEFEWRFQTSTPTHLYASPAIPRWDGRPLPPGERLLVVAEQSLSDILLFVRYVKVLQAMGVATSLCVPPKLATLIQASDLDAAPLMPEQANAITTGRSIPLASLPRHLGVTAEHPILTAPYLKTTEELKRRWSHRLASERRPVIGLHWQGDPSHETEQRRDRSISLEALAPLAANSDVSLLALQKGSGHEQLLCCSFRDRFVACQDQVSNTWDFLETAAIITHCDLVITVDTVSAQLAAGLGVPTWLLLKQVPDWPWGLAAERTFWFPSMRLFRQHQHGHWAEVIDRVCDQLRRCVEASQPFV